MMMAAVDAGSRAGTTGTDAALRDAAAADPPVNCWSTV